MTILDLTARLGECHDCGARIDARGVFCLACITADERRRLTAAKGGDGEGRRTANSEAPSPSFGAVGATATRPSPRFVSGPTETHKGISDHGSTFATTTPGARTPGEVETTTA